MGNKINKIYYNGNIYNGNSHILLIKKKENWFPMKCNMLQRHAQPYNSLTGDVTFDSNHPELGMHFLFGREDEEGSGMSGYSQTMNQV